MRRVILVALLIVPLIGANGAPQAIDPADDGLGGVDVPSRLDLRSVQFHTAGPDTYDVVVHVEDLIAHDAPGAFAEGTTFQSWMVTFSAADHDFLLNIGQDIDGDSFVELTVTDVERSYGDHPRSDHEEYLFDDVPVELDMDEASDRITVTLPREWMLTRPAPGVDGESISFTAGTRFTAIEAYAMHGPGTVEPSAIGVTANCGACFPVDATFAHWPFVMEGPTHNPWLVPIAHADGIHVHNPTSIVQVLSSDAGAIEIEPGATHVVPGPVHDAATPVTWLADPATSAVAQVEVTHHLYTPLTRFDDHVMPVVSEAPTTVEQIAFAQEITGLSIIGRWQSQPLLAPMHLDDMVWSMDVAWQDAQDAELVLAITDGMDSSLDAALAATVIALTGSDGARTVEASIPAGVDLVAGQRLHLAAWVRGDAGELTTYIGGPEPARIEATSRVPGATMPGQAMLALPLLSMLQGATDGINSTLIATEQGLFLQHLGVGSIAVGGSGWNAVVEIPDVVQTDIDPPDLSPPLASPVFNSGGVTVPDDRLPAGGTMRYYRDLYEQGIAHTENYTGEWQRAEILGHLELEYLSSGAAQSYIAGTVPATAASVAWGDVILAENPLAPTIHIDTDVVLGGITAAAPAIQLPAPAMDDFSDGLLEVVSADTIDGIEITHSTTVLEGSMHADDRWHLLGVPAEALDLNLTTLLPEAGWIAFEDQGSTLVLPSADADGFVTDSGWFAVFDHGGTMVSGLVVAGDATTSSITVDAGFAIETQYAAVEDLLAARYILEYEVADLDATRYAGVLDLHDQDRNELGIIYANGAKSAGVGWAGSRADIEASADLQGWWGNLWGKGDVWDIQIEAHSSQGGKHLRFIAPADVLDDAAYAFTLDGQTIDPVEVLSDGHTAVITVEIDHFSLRMVQMQEVIPGVPVWIATSGFVLFGLVAAYESTVLTRRLRSRSAKRALEAPTMDGVMLRSQAAQRAAAKPQPRRHPTIRCTSCKTVQWHGDDPACIQCAHPLPQKVAP